MAVRAGRRVRAIRRGADTHECRGSGRLAVIRQLARREIPPEAPVRVLAPQLQKHMTCDFVTAGSVVRPGVTKLTTTFWARLRIGHCSLYRLLRPIWFSSTTAGTFCAHNERPVQNVTCRCLKCWSRARACRGQARSGARAIQHQAGHALSEAQAVVLASVL